MTDSVERLQNMPSTASQKRYGDLHGMRADTTFTAPLMTV